MAQATPFKPKALLFDVFGTTVNWRDTVATHLQSRAATALNAPTSSLPSATRLAAASTSWPLFAQQWRDAYKHFTRSQSALLAPPSNTITTTSSPPSSPSNPDPPSSFQTVDQHHHDALISLLAANNLQDLWPPDEVHAISRIWHFLAPWPDAAPGLAALNARGIVTATLSNGNVALQRDLTAHARLPFARTFSAEQFHAYKPDPRTYRGACAELGLLLRPGEVGMVAAHLGDLRAARACGLRTVYVEREREGDWGEVEVREARGWVDVWVGLHEGGFVELARRLG